MKTLLATAIATALVTAPVLAAPAWHDDLEAAREEAAREGKDLFLKFSGATNWCRRFEKEILSDDAFREAAKRFVLVELSLPADPSVLPAEVREEREKVRERFGVRTVPTVILCDAQGRPYARSGYRTGGAVAYASHLADLEAIRAKRDAAFATARSATGAERAAAYETALALVPAEALETFYREEYDQLAALAPQCKLLANLKTEAAAREQRDGFKDFFTRRDFEGALAHADTLVKEGALEGEARQQVLFYKLNAYMAMERFDEALALVDEIEAVAPESRFGSGAKRFRTHLEGLKAKAAARKSDDGGKEGKPAPGTGAPRPDSTSRLPFRGGVWWIAEEKPAGEGGAEKAERKGKPDREAELRNAIAEAEKELAAMTGKIERDHARWEKIENERAVSQNRIVELKAALADEEAKVAALDEEVAALEKGHNQDHDRADALAKVLKARQAELKDFESKQDEITKLEKQAAELRKRAEALRKRADELRKN